jgi:hypothetical protein
LTFNLSITALAVYFTFNSFDILKNIPSVDLFYMGSLLTHVKEDDDDDGLKFTSLEDTDDPESMHDSRKITADSHERLMHDLNDYGDIFDFDPQNSPDPPCIIVDDDDDNDGEIRDVHRKQTTQQDYLDSDYSLNSRFNAPYHVHK